LDPVRNPGKSIFYTDRSGLLLVRATLKDLDIIERKIAALRIAAGNEPAPGTVPESPSSPMTNSGSVSNRLSSPGLTAEQNVKASTLVQDGKLLYEMDKLDEAEGKLKLAIKSDPHNEAALYYLNLVSAAKFARAAKLHQMPEEAAVNEAVYRQANRITLRQRLADARAAQDRHALASAAKLYEDAWELVLRIGSGVDAERDQTIAGLTAVRMELARAAQARGDYKEARTQVGDVLRVDPTSAVAVEFKSKNEKLLAEQRGKIPSEEVRSEVPAIIEEQVKASTLVHDGKLLYEMGKLDEAEAKLEKAITKDPQNQAAAYYLSLVKEARQKTTGGLGQWLSTPAPHAQTNLIKRQAIVHMLDNIRLDQVAFDATPLSEVLRFLGDESRKGDPEQRGINFILNQNTDSGTSAAAATLGPDGRPLPPGPAEQVDLSSIAINLKYPLTNIRLADVLDAIVKVADRPIKYSIEDYGVVFSARARQQSPPLYLRTFKVDPNTLLEGLHLSKRQVETSGRDVVTRALRDCFARAGVDLDPARNPAKAVFFNDRQGMVVARATMQDLDIIEAVIQMLNYAPPQINLKCKVVAVSAGDTKALGFDWYLGNMLMNSGLTGGQVGTAPSSNGVPTVANPLGVFSDNPSARATLTPSTNTQPLTSVTRLVNSPSFTTTGILTDPQFTVLIKALEQRAGTELIAQPEATVLSGRQVLCKATEVHTVVKGIKDKALTPPGVTSTNKDENSVFGVEPMEFGVELDMKPTVLEDGYTIRMPVAATVLSFLGYDDAPTNRVAAYVNGKWEWVTPPLPCIRIQQMASTANVHDGQTLVLGGLVSERIIAFKDQVPVLGELPVVGRLFRSESKNTQKRDLLIFVTPTIIDPAGNRVHSPDENPSSPNEIPAQPPR
jgi:general secretion pathway protein D